MSLFAIGDLHLHFQSELKAPGQLREPVWRNHEVRFRQNCEKLIKQDDTLVLVGDHSWGKKLPECEKDLEYICSLPGRKILIRGNHDMFWDAKKTDCLNQQYAGKLFSCRTTILHTRIMRLSGAKGTLSKARSACAEIKSWVGMVSRNLLLSSESNAKRSD